MSKFNPSKLAVQFLSPAGEWSPFDHRKYTLTHSDTTGELFLSIGAHYDLPSINMNIRDEVLAEWLPQMGSSILLGKVYVSGGEFDERSSERRFMIFRRELGLAISALIYGDRRFLYHYPRLLDSSIFIKFESIFPKFNKMYSYGTPYQYLHAITNEAKPTQ